VRRRVFVLLVLAAAAACGIDAVGTSTAPTDLPPDPSERIDGAAGDAREDGERPDGAMIVDASPDACACPADFVCNDGGCIDRGSTHFTLSANPSGAWAWGYRDGDASAGTFVAYAVAFADGTQGIDEWSTTVGSVTPGVFRNPSAMVIHPYASFTMAPAQMAFHPGPLNEHSIVRWTAPIAREFAARVVVSGLSGWMSAPPTTTGVTVTKTIDGGTSLVGMASVGGDGGLGDAGVGPFTIDVPTATFAPGDVLDVAVDYGANGNFGYDSTGVEVTILAP
jgi:hypothetical protein